MNKFLEASSVVYLGPPGTHSHGAALRIFSPDSLKDADTIQEVCAKVLAGEAEYGVLPIENSIGGIVQEVIDTLLELPLHVVGSLTLPIHHALLGKARNMSEIRMVSSHPQALRQCKVWLSKNLPNAEIRPSTSTTQFSKEETAPAMGFIADTGAAKLYDLNVLAENIEDSPYNFTEFYIVATQPQPTTSRTLAAQKSVLVVRTQDRPGILRDILSCFSDRNINLTKLHSRAIPGEKQDYYFFLEVSVLPSYDLFKEILGAIQPLCTSVRILGCV